MPLVGGLWSGGPREGDGSLGGEPGCGGGGGLEREAGQKGHRSNSVAVPFTELGTQAWSFKGQNPAPSGGREE